MIDKEDILKIFGDIKPGFYEEQAIKIIASVENLYIENGFLKCKFNNGMSLYSLIQFIVKGIQLGEKDNYCDCKIEKWKIY